MNKKTTLKTLAFLAILICSIAAPILVNRFMVQASKSSYDSEYMTVSGVLSTDSYVLFPFEKKNLTIGFSKYGEMVDYSTKVGLNYNGETDPFAPGEAKVTETQWIEGWIINITYVEGGYYRNTWARATYSDYASGTEGIGGIWKEGCTDGSSGLTNRGGRKTSGGAVTDPIKVLYNGPRRFVALLRTAIYKEAVTHATPLVNLTFTIVFNKDKKQVVIFKDIKRTDTGKNIGDMQIEFSNRGEWDLGNGNPPKSYAHFYTSELKSTLYNGHYQYWYNSTNIPSGYNGTYDVCQIIDDQLKYVGWAAYWPRPICSYVGATQLAEADRETILHSISTKTEFHNLTTSTPNIILTLNPIPYPQKNSTAVFWLEEPMVFVNDRNKVINGTNIASNVTYCEGNNTVYFSTGYIPGANDIVKIVYKTQCSQADMGYEPNSPFVIGEWDFKMLDATDMFRAVTIYGVTDLHDGNDAGIGSGRTNVLDAEVQYYLNETFNPYDLYSAVDKQEDRWLKKETLTSSLTAGANYTLTSGLDDQLYYTQFSAEHASIGATSPTWTGYFIRDNTPTYPVNSTWVNAYEDGTASTAHSKNWCLELNATGQEALKITPIVGTPTSTAPLTLQLKDLVDFGFWYKMISGTKGPSVQIKVYQYPDGNESHGDWVNIRAEPNNPIVTTVWNHYTLNNITSYVPGAYADTPFDVGTGGTGLSGFHSYEYWTSILGEHILGEYYVGSVMVTMDPSVTGVGSRALIDDLSVAYLAKPSGIRYERVYNMEEDKLIPSDWDAYCSFAERVLINGTLIKRHDTANTTAHEDYYDINFETGNITFYHWATGLNYHAWDLGIGTHVKVLYSTIEENEKGRYEWMVLGKNARTVDSAAAAYVSEAFDSTKDIRVEMMGMDIREFDYGPNSPYVMSGPGTATRADYNDSLGRPHLKDDWCTTWPVASSNMIFMAGPRANLGTEYMNEFTNAFFARSEYVVNNTGQSNTIMGLSCWNRNNYTSGYGVISVYKDLNGTVGLVFWGYDADDYYYTCKWFWSYPAGITCPDGTTVVYSGIEYLQHENLGVTDIILEITYPTLDPTHPTVGVSSERLGTISEKTQHDP